MSKTVGPGRFSRFPGRKSVLCFLLLVCSLLFLFSTHQESASAMLPMAGVGFSVGMDGSGSPTVRAAAAVPTPTVHGAHQSASAALARIYQGNPAQYATDQEYQTWWPSTCSTTSMTEVINAYRTLAGKSPYRITDVLAAEVQAGAISASQGLLDGFAGIRDTVAHFGFKATDLSGSALDTVLAAANAGEPVIISFPPQTWAGGHLLVLLGGDAQQVQLADSSGINMRVMTRTTFTHYWRGFAVLVTPQ